MQITIFAKKRSTSEGKTFFNYLATLPLKDGTEQTVTVKFREDVIRPKPENCPMNIKFEKDNASISKRTYEKDDGSTGIGYTLWVGDWAEGDPYVDESFEEFDV